MFLKAGVDIGYVKLSQTRLTSEPVTGESRTDLLAGLH